jgi:glycosyltransferase involved in cell wall biosynthesis
VLLALHARGLQERLDRERPSRRVLYVWHPLQLKTVERLDYDVLVYHPFDMFRHFSDTSNHTMELEDRLCRLADAVITPHHAVAESLGHPRSHVVHNGVFLPAFPDYRSLPASPQLRDLSRPVVGYLGVINDKIDFGILLDAARARPDWQFVMVGPTRSGRWRDSEAFGAFAGLENTKFLPGVPIDRVAPIMAGFDVGAIPYRLEGWAGYSESPLKLYQYWAMGVPVVASPLPTFVSEPGAIEVGASGWEWVAAIERLLEARSEDRRSALRQRALGHSWEEKAVRVMSIIDGL